MQKQALKHHTVAIVGGGQSGLSLSYYLKQRGIDHVVLEKHGLVHTWQTQRWDSFCLVTPNWQCKLPGWSYTGTDPDGFMKREEIIDYLKGFVQHVNAPVQTGVTVQQVTPQPHGGWWRTPRIWAWTLRSWPS